MYYDGGELYFIGEVDPFGGASGPFVKVGIVRDKEGRSSADRLAEHQTGNPRRLSLLEVERSPIVEALETILHARFAPIRVGGEWLHLGDGRYGEVLGTARTMAAQARSIDADLRAAEELKKVLSGDQLRAATEELVDLHRQWAVADVVVKRLSEAVTAIKKLFAVAHASDIPVAQFFNAIPRKGSTKFNEALFRQEHPELVDQYLKQVTSISQRFSPRAMKAADQPGAIQQHPHVASLLDRVGQLQVLDVRSIDFANLHETYLEVLAVRAPWEWEEDLAEAQLRSACVDAAGIDGICTWNRRETTQEKLDTTALKKQEPELYEKFCAALPSTVAHEVARDRNYTLVK